MTIDQWYQSRKGQSLLVPGANEADRGQCVQAADYALYEVYGFDYVWADAIDWWNKFEQIPQLKTNFIKVSDSAIKKGDFVIFNTKVGSQYGHIDIAMADGNYDMFTGADSNWGGNKTLHLVDHVNKSYIIGSLRPKGGQVVMFNEGDRVNLNTYFYGKDIGFFKTLVGVDWKTAMYAIFKKGSEFDNQYKVNEGDVKNINTQLGTGTADTFKGQNWKDLYYYFAVPNLPAVNYIEAGVIDGVKRYNKKAN